MSVFTKFFLIVVLVVGFAGVVKADPVRITSGNLLIFPLGGSTISEFRFAGNGLHGSGGNGGSNPIVQFNQELCTFGCAFGSTVGASSLVTTGNIYSNLGFPAFYSGRFVYQGTTYNLQEGIFNFSTQPFALSNNGTNQQFLPTPFTMTGTLEFRSLSVGVPNIIIPISSSGTAVLNYVYNDGTQFFPFGPSGTSSLVTVSYNFGSTDGNPVPTPTIFNTPTPTPEPVPEPTTILLLGTGLAGVIGYSKRRRKRLKQTE